VVLGVGLDTFSLRNPHAGLCVRVFEVDYPATCLSGSGSPTSAGEGSFDVVGPTRVPHP
jgi:hypothetical protein